MKRLVDISKINQDQRKVILALANPTEFYKGHHSASSMRGVPYEKIIEKTQLSIEKTLLSLGWLEAIGMVGHDVAIIRKTLDYLGQTNIEVAGQSVVRMFYLTEEGQKVLQELQKEVN